MAKPKGFLRLTCDEQLADLEDELSRERIYEVSLRSKRFVVEGLQEGDAIFVDVRPAIIEVLLHELLHRRQPRLSERTVDTTAKRLVAHLDEMGKWKWYRAYLKVRKKAPPVDVAD